MRAFLDDYCLRKRLRLSERQKNYLVKILKDGNPEYFPYRMEGEGYSDWDVEYLIRRQLGIVICAHCGKQTSFGDGFYLRDGNTYCSLSCLCKEENITRERYYAENEIDNATGWSEGHALVLVMEYAELKAKYLEDVKAYCKKEGIDTIKDYEIEYVVKRLVELEDDTSDEELKIYNVIHSEVGIIRCDNCGKYNLAEDGYFCAGDARYCCLECLLEDNDITEEEYNEEYNDGEGDMFWTSGEV